MRLAQKPLKTPAAQTQENREVFREGAGHEPPQPVLVNFTTVDEDPARARDLHEQYSMEDARSTIDHYEFTNPRLETINGYEYYAGLRRNINKHGLPAFNRFLADLQMGGSPEEMIEQTVDRVRALNAGGVVNVLSFGSMTKEAAAHNLDVYA